MTKKKTTRPTAPNQLDPRDALLEAKGVEYTYLARAAAGSLNPLDENFVLLGKSEDPRCVKVLFKDTIEDLLSKVFRPVPVPPSRHTRQRRKRP